MVKLYLECTSGISGDMAVGALLDLGADRGKLEEVLATVPAGGFSVKITTVSRSGIEACDFAVLLDPEHENHDHDMEYLYGPEPHHGPGPGPHHGPGPHDDPWGPPPPYGMYGPGWDPHCPPYGPGPEHHHEHRNLSDVYAVIDGTQMSDGARETAKEIFRIVAEAESEVHGLPIEEVHFHEVGAVDSIVDIIAFAVCWDDLRQKETIDEVIVPVLYEGTGTVRCQHGVLPVPVPAVAAIARRKGLRLHLLPDRGEFVTPTGAAIAAALQTSDRLPEEFTIRKTGLGAGKRTYPCRTGMLRAMLIEDVS